MKNFLFSHLLEANCGKICLLSFFLCKINPLKGYFKCFIFQYMIEVHRTHVRNLLIHISFLIFCSDAGRANRLMIFLCYRSLKISMFVVSVAVTSCLLRLPTYLYFFRSNFSRQINSNGNIHDFIRYGARIKKDMHLFFCDENFWLCNCSIKQAGFISKQKTTNQK